LHFTPPSSASINLLDRLFAEIASGNCRRSEGFVDPDTAIVPVSLEISKNRLSFFRSPLRTWLP
jgi:hypothetical protein